MSDYERGFIMLCNINTEAECLRRNLFGDVARKLTDLSEIKPGDIGLLMNFEMDQLLGIFKARSKARMQIEAKAWSGKFPAQVQVELIGELQRIKDAAHILKTAGIELKPNDWGAPIPPYPVYGREIMDKILCRFKES